MNGQTDCKCTKSARISGRTRRFFISLHPVLLHLAVQRGLADMQQRGGMATVAAAQGERLLYRGLPFRIALRVRVDAARKGRAAVRNPILGR